MTSRPPEHVLHSLQELDRAYREKYRQATAPLSLAEINQHYAKPQQQAGDPPPEDRKP